MNLSWTRALGSNEINFKLFSMALQVRLRDLFDLRSPRLSARLSSHKWFVFLFCLFMFHKLSDISTIRYTPSRVESSWASLSPSPSLLEMPRCRSRFYLNGTHQRSFGCVSLYLSLSLSFTLSLSSSPLSTWWWWSSVVVAPFVSVRLCRLRLVLCFKI